MGRSYMAGITFAVDISVSIISIFMTLWFGGGCHFLLSSSLPWAFFRAEEREGKVLQRKFSKSETHNRCWLYFPCPTLLQELGIHVRKHRFM